MTEAGQPAKKLCKYTSGVWRCPFEAEPGHDLCIFHLPTDKKTEEDFWRHMAWYLTALYGRAQEKEVIAYWQSGRAPAWVRNCGAAPQNVLSRYLETAQRERAWRFAGFVFPAMDEQHSFDKMVLPWCDFHEAFFVGHASFGYVHFQEEAVFNEARFDDKADFAGAWFNSVAFFVGANFNAGACFRAARFSEPEASFTDATFGAEADFRSASFVAKACFDHVRFGGTALFSRADFGAGADFSSATLGTNGDFSHARFGAMLSFERGRFCGNTTSFEDAEFSGQVWFRRVTMDTLLVMRYAQLRNQMLFDGTRLEGRTRVLLWGLNFVHGMSDVAMGARELAYHRTGTTVANIKQSVWRGSLVEPAGQVVFRDIKANMNRVSFLHTDILTDRLLVRFSNVEWETNPRRFILDAKFAFVNNKEWSREKLIAETGLPDWAIDQLPQLYFADRQELEPKSQQLQGCEQLVKQDVERIAREIRLSYEKYGHYGDAGDYYVAEMDFRRKRTPWLLLHFPELKTERRWWRRAWKRLTGFLSSLSYRLVLELYRFTSHYGESPGRALLSSLVTLSLSSYAFVIAGFEFMGRTVNRDMRFDLSQIGPTVSDLWLGFRMALANLMPGNLRADVLGLKLTSEASKSWAVAQVICTYILITLLLLAIRRRFRR